MKVFFRTNLGSLDAKKLGLDHEDCMAGDSAEVSKEAGEALTKAGIATTDPEDQLVRSAQGKPDKDEDKAKVKAVAKAPELAAPLK